MYLAYPAQGINPANLPFDLQLAATAKSLQSCPTLCDPRDGSPPGSTIPGILQTGTLEWVAISFSNAWKWKVKVKSLSRDPMDCSPPGSSVHGIFQAIVLEWIAISFSRVSSQPRDRTRVSSIPGRCFNLWATLCSYIVDRHFIIWDTRLVCAQYATGEEWRNNSRKN